MVESKLAAEVYTVEGIGPLADEARAGPKL